MFKNLMNRLKKVHLFSASCTLLIIVLCLIAVLVNNRNDAKQASENAYNSAFYELVSYVQNVETYLAQKHSQMCGEKQT